ncbi:hypothetical protein [Alteromonas macleodii]|uniref:hypothetical protein n=1 Tax=Alteromonas macleodii TaxID=28108 RepID=UPI003140AAE2|tara:strand:+ start:170896 stop:171936 length:1041 start_codon:yes stop_codon:yes gene_type:complete
MKKIITIGAIGLVGVISHFAIQGSVKMSVTEKFKERIASISESSGQKLVHEYGDVSFNYMDMSAIINDVKIYIGGKPGVATLMVDSYKYNPFKDSAILHGLTALSTTGQTGAMSMATADSLSISGSPLVKEKDWKSLGLSAENLKVSKKIYQNFFAPDFAPIADAFLEDGIDINITSNKNDISSMTFSVLSPGMVDLKVSGKYKNVERTPEGTFVDPDTGLPLSVGASSSGVETIVHAFSVTAKDLGMRQKVFSWGAGFSQTPSVDDAEKFKEGFVRGIDSYINQVVPYNFLPIEVLNDFIKFVDEGDELSFSVELKEPQPISNIQQHIMGYGDLKAFENAKVSVH